MEHWITFEDLMFSQQCCWSFTLSCRTGSSKVVAVQDIVSYEHYMTVRGYFNNNPTWQINEVYLLHLVWGSTVTERYFKKLPSLSAGRNIIAV